MKTIVFILLLTLTQITYSQWVECNNGFSNTDSTITALAVSGSNIIAGTYEDGIFVSTNNGNNWIQKNNGLTNLNVKAIAVSGNNIYVGTGAVGGSIFLSTDGGNTWTLKKGNDSIEVYSLSANDNVVIAGTNHGLFVSTDYGDSWVAKHKNIGSFFAFAISGNNIYGGTSIGLFVSTDTGENWTQYNALKDLIITSIFINGNNIYAATQGLGANLKFGGLYYSSDNGTNWNYIFHDAPPLDSSGFVATVIVVDNKIFIGNNGGVFYSTNNGNSWTQKNDGISDVIPSVWSLVTSGNYIFAGTYSGFEGTGVGVFRALLGDFTSVEGGGKELEYNIFPNPAKNMARLWLPEGGAPLGNFFLCNPLGVKVKEFHYSVSDAGQSIEFDISDLPAGIYFLTLKTASGVVTKQFAVVR